MNGILGPEGSFPSALLFGDFPGSRSFTGPVVPRPTLAERVEIALEARRHFARHLAQSKVKRALRHRAPPATDRVYRPGDKVLVWREEQVENRISEWLGSYTVVSFESNSKIILIQKSADARYERYNVVQVKPSSQPTEAFTDFIETLYYSMRQFALSHTDLSVNMTDVIKKTTNEHIRWR